MDFVKEMDQAILGLKTWLELRGTHLGAGKK